VPETVVLSSASELVRIQDNVNQAWTMKPAVSLVPLFALSSVLPVSHAAGTQWSVSTLKDMGGNVCFDHACP